MSWKRFKGRGGGVHRGSMLFIWFIFTVKASNQPKITHDPNHRGDTESALSLKPWRCLHGPRLRSTLPFCKGLKSCSRGVLIESPGSSLHFLSQATGSPERILQSRLHAARPRGTQRQWPWNGTVCPDADYIWSSRLLLLCMRGSRGQWMVEHLRFLVSPSCQLTNKGIKGFKTAKRKAFYFYFCA